MSHRCVAKIFGVSLVLFGNLLENDFRPRLAETKKNISSLVKMSRVMTQRIMAKSWDNWKSWTGFFLGGLLLLIELVFLLLYISFALILL